MRRLNPGIASRGRAKRDLPRRCLRGWADGGGRSDGGGEGGLGGDGGGESVERENEERDVVGRGVVKRERGIGREGGIEGRERGGEEEKDRVKSSIFS